MEEPALEGDQVRIETPEHVVFQYELAGLGSRIIAGLIDIMLIGLALLALVLIVIAFAGGLQGLGSWAVALGAVTAFFTSGAIPSSSRSSGRADPGKRLLSMRSSRRAGTR
jgi:uncharacterized RDD family membrane protein YckC